MNKLTLIAFSFSLPFISACTPSMPTLPEMPSLPAMPDFMPDMSLPTLYKDDIQQGSVLDRFKINQLKVGMSQAQVQNLIGSPSIIDSFHNNQWNYINHSTLHEKDDIHYRLILEFSNGKLIKIDTSGITTLPALTDKEKALEEKRLADEKAAAEALEQAKIKAQQLAKKKAKAAEQQRITEQTLAAEKAKAEEKAKAKAKAELEKKINLEQIAQQELALQKSIEAEKLKKIQAKKQAQKQFEQKPVAKQEVIKAADEVKEPVETPWYKFW